MPKTPFIYIYKIKNKLITEFFLLKKKQERLKCRLVRELRIKTPREYKLLFVNKTKNKKLLLSAKVISRAGEMDQWLKEFSVLLRT